MHMIYAINNRGIYRGFHQCPEGRKSITKPNGKVLKGRWLTGELVTIPMPTPSGATPQMPVLCLSKAGHRMESISRSAVCVCSISLFSGTWAETNWDGLLKAQQQQWLKTGHSSSDWKGIPVFEGDIFYNKETKRFYVATYELLSGFKLEDTAADTRDTTWFFGETMIQRGNIWNPPKGFPMDKISTFHKKRGVELRVEEVDF